MKCVTAFWVVIVALVTMFVVHCWATGFARVIGLGEVEETFFEIAIDERLGSPIGVFRYSDYYGGKDIFGEVHNVKMELPSKIWFDGSYSEKEGVKLSFEVIIEDLDKIEQDQAKFYLTCSDGFKKIRCYQRGY